MASISIQSVSLAYPIYHRTAAGAQSRGSDGPQRIFFDKASRPRGVKALENISLELTSGHRIGLVGRNGSGKTTLLHILAGLLPPDKGEVEIRGQITSLININLGMQAQASGHTNITLRGLASGQSRSAIEAARPKIAEFCELGDFLHLPVETYSAGMRMRLSFAIATTFQPDILILDEWISTGDAHFKKKAAQRMNAFSDAASLMVLATHSPSMVEATCNRVIWLDEGRIKMDGPPSQVLPAYNSAAASSDPDRSV